jgi:UPF0755 protein
MYKKDTGVKTSKLWLAAAVAGFILLLGGVWALRTWYSDNLKPVSSSQETIYFTVDLGDSRDEIADKLERQGIIRSATAFKNYIRTNEIENLQAGTYALSPSLSVERIVNKMVKGEIAKNLLTILPAKRLDQIKEAFVKEKYSGNEIENAFNPANYRNHPALSSLPAGASLEGYLYPDSFQKVSGTPAATIISQSLDEMQKHLTADIINGFGKQGLNTYQGITLSSMVLQETDDPKYQASVAQVFLNRISRNMLLQSDPTALYASAAAGKPKDLKINSPYNTYTSPWPIPGPISNVTKEAMKAVANPSGVQHLYFVTGDDGVFHFTNTLEEHQEAVRRYCTKKCG